MAENVAAYPLQWPVARKRRPPARASRLLDGREHNDMPEGAR